MYPAKDEILFIKLPAKSNLDKRKSALEKILAEIDFSKFISEKDKVGIKTHIGDVNNTTHISPELIAIGVKKVKEQKALPFITETSTLYSGPRSNAITHLELAQKHGFNYETLDAPFIMCDGLFGNTEIEVPIKGILFDKVNIARDAVLCDALIVVTHPTGHIVSGVGACIKNVGMGLSSRKGKMHQHSSIKPFIKPEECTLCGQCIKWCPVQAISEIDGAAKIDGNICIGCGECLTLCKFFAVKFNWGNGSEELQKMMAEYALGALENKKGKALFINILTDMTKDCDCMSIKQEPIIDDIGILVGIDPVAIDQATLDLTRKFNDQNLGRFSHPNLNPEIQLEHAEKIGLGSRKYKLKEI
ncbi:MAG: DUF362 domain-containing protein [Candidatus Cloacimonetes bacterium]|nr:DUF362 domain-containing protein [Candidatus Cloacimonadota bacterium]MCF7814933.1 DUF362 domain-containing protein [Candidatus Cloacimonadota bacterium]MCF7868141.1 DUF362 domain-containing protein [Candidatus Cloacimonadota bacterium]MCF7883607.1 DUF362 domain-containing protein [Candidatus Cloacimonadota bacterium]